MTTTLREVLAQPPTQEGPAGKAWLVETEWTRSAEAALATWVVFRPGAHPLWSWYFISVVSLRELPGMPPAVKRYPEAQYEFVIMSLEPGETPDTQPEGPPFKYMVPQDVVFQFHGTDEAQAKQLCAVSVKTIVDGLMSPDRDYRSQWMGALATTVRHIVEGKHPLH